MNIKTKFGMLALALALLVPAGKALAAVAPTITISGDNPATVNVGATYTDAGASVSDTFGTPLPINTTGLPVDTSVPGTFSVTYSADPISDPDNPDGPPLIIASATRTVNVVGPAVTTDAATSITTSDATLNATNGGSAATGHSFWVSTTPGFDVSSPSIPSGVYSTPDLGAIDANTSFNASLSTVTTAGVPSNMPAITPGTTYYFVAWVLVDGTWKHGEILSFTTTVPESATLILVKRTIGGDANFNFTLTGSTSTSTSLSTDGGYATTTLTINVGTTTITEAATSGWNFLSAYCKYDGQSVGVDGIGGSKIIDVDNGDTVTCRFTNTSTGVGNIRVVKNVVASDGETDVSDNHTFTAVLGGEASTSFSEDYSGYFWGLTPGSYTITENSDADYDLVLISGDANEELPGVQVSVVGGTLTTVTITNKQHATSSGETSGGGGNNQNSGGPTGGGNVLPNGGGAVLGASTDTTKTENACRPLITSYMRRGSSNDPAQVKILQNFLNSQNLGVVLEVSGVFDLQTENAVKAFQLKYLKEILSPWGITQPTGYAYKTTLRWINHLNCPNETLPPLSL